MDATGFHAWLRRDNARPGERYRLNTDNSAEKYVGRAQAVETHEQIDLDAVFDRGRMPGLIETTRARPDLSAKVVCDYMTALRAYASFRGA